MSNSLATEQTASEWRVRVLLRLC